MSENIQSIANGTYVIGQTSATTYQAGQGISITQPSEGTVRISNDETVLWSGTMVVNNRTNTATLSESVYNFERIRIYDDWLYNQPTKCTEFDTKSQPMNRFGTVHASIDSYNFEANPGFFIGVNYYSLSDNGTKLRTERNFIFSVKSSTNLSASERNASRIYKIIGINRISGSNT